MPRAKTKPKKVARSIGLPTWSSRALLLLVILFVGMIRVRLLNFPLERDEGEYAYGGQLILHGMAPYQLCYSMKMPGTAAAYALFTEIFGQTRIGVHLGLLVVNSATIILVYFLALRLFGKLAAVVACASFALLSVEPALLGFAGHATQFVVLPAVGGILLLLKAIDSEKLSRFFFAGLALGLAYLMKQPGMFFVLFALFYLTYCEWRRGWRWARLARSAGLLLLGSLIPLALTCLLMLWAGVFRQFWFWTFSYAQQYGTALTLSRGFEIFWQSFTRLVPPAAPIWLIAAAGLIALLWTPKARTDIVFILALLVFSFAAVCPGFYFRQHYFVLLLPVVSLLCGLAVSVSTSLLESQDGYLWSTIPTLLFVAALGFSVAHDFAFFFETEPLEACRKIYGPNPFPEALKIADFVSARSAQGDRIAIIGSEPEIYFYSGRLSATGYVYMYPLMESQPFAARMQQDMISEIERSNPRFVIFVDVATSWLRAADSDEDILHWSEQYVRHNYRQVGVVDIGEKGSIYRWGESAATYRAVSPFKIAVFQRAE